MTSYNYCFTAWENDGCIAWDSPIVLPHDIVYLMAGHEVCPTTGRKHLQGHVEFTQSKTRSAAQKAMKCKTLNMRIRNGTWEENFIYCSKEGNYFEVGTRKQQGQRKDLDAIKEEIDEGASSESIAENHFSKWVVYNRSFEKYRYMKMKRDTSITPEVIFIHGPPGCGKTFEAIEAGATNVCYNGKFMLNYSGEKVVLFDDVDRDTFPVRSYMLQLLDRYEMMVEVKCSQVPWMAEKIYLTSNYSLEDLGWDRDEAITRRITEVRKLIKRDK